MVATGICRTLFAAGLFGLVAWSGMVSIAVIGGK